VRGAAQRRPVTAQRSMGRSGSQVRTGKRSGGLGSAV